MKAIRVKGQGREWLFLVLAAAFMFYLLRPTDGRFAAFLIIGVFYVVGQVGGHADRWRSRTGSLVPAVTLVALSGFAAGMAIAWTMAGRH